jgi:hypothetical protein
VTITQNRGAAARGITARPGAQCRPRVRTGPAEARGLAGGAAPWILGYGLPWPPAGAPRKRAPRREELRERRRRASQRPHRPHAPVARKRPGLPSPSAAPRAARRHHLPRTAPTIRGAQPARARLCPRARHARPTSRCASAGAAHPHSGTPRAPRARARALLTCPAPSLSLHNVITRAPKLASAHLVVLSRLVELPTAVESAKLPAATVAVACCVPATPMQSLRGNAGGKPPGRPPRSACTSPSTTPDPARALITASLRTQPSRRRRPRRPRATETLCQLSRRLSGVLMAFFRRPPATTPHHLLGRVSRLAERLGGRAGRRCRRRRSATAARPLRILASTLSHLHAVSLLRSFAFNDNLRLARPLRAVRANRLRKALRVGWARGHILLVHLQRVGLVGALVLPAAREEKC